MERLLRISAQKIRQVQKGFVRYLYQHIDWTQSLIIITGFRGTGKTTLLLQKAAERDEKSVIYLSLDDIYFETNRLVFTIEELVQAGYKYFFLDEVHRYHHWSEDLKIIYDNHPDIFTVASGSSILDINKGMGDLSRRAITYELYGLSFREYLEMAENIRIPATNLERLVDDHGEILEVYEENREIQKKYNAYLKHGYYPFFSEGIVSYGPKLSQIINQVIENDIGPYEDLSYTSVRNMKKLLYIISQSVPFKPNITKLAERLGSSRNSVLKTLDIMERSRLISLLRSETKGISYLQKPEKIYLQNTNLIHMLSEDRPDTGNLRETFFFSQLTPDYHIYSSRFADFTIDNHYTFEIGGPGKTANQIKDIPKSYLALDGIRTGSGNRIPLWSFGLLY